MSFIIDLKDKVVLVTGVSSGIGYGTARAFAHAGAHVAGCAVNRWMIQVLRSFVRL